MDGWLADRSRYFISVEVFSLLICLVVVWLVGWMDDWLADRSR